MGFSNLIQGYSDKMWENGKNLMKYILQRGGRIDYDFKVPSMRLPNYKGEVSVLGTTLDMMKKMTEHSITSYKHAMNKYVHDGQPEKDSYDPGVSLIK